MKRVQISFNAGGKGNGCGKEQRPSSRSWHQLCAFPRQLDHLFKQLHIPATPKNKILRLKSSHSHHRQPFSNSQQVLTQNSRIQHRTTTDHPEHSRSHTQQQPQKHSEKQQARDRTQVIHSRTNPRCHLLRKNSIPIQENRAKQPLSRTQRHSFVGLANPEQLLQVTQVKKMSLNTKTERDSYRSQMQASPVLKKKPQLAKKWWGVTDRPWSPRRHNLDFQTINQFLSNY